LVNKNIIISCIVYTVYSIANNKFTHFQAIRCLYAHELENNIDTIYLFRGKYMNIYYWILKMHRFKFDKQFFYFIILPIIVCIVFNN